MIWFIKSYIYTKHHTTQTTTHREGELRLARVGLDGGHVVVAGAEAPFVHGDEVPLGADRVKVLELFLVIWVCGGGGGIGRRDDGGQSRGLLLARSRPRARGVRCMQPTAHNPTQPNRTNKQTQTHLHTWAASKT